MIASEVVSTIEIDREVAEAVLREIEGAPGG